ncbi:MAG: hypothetical protein JRG97_06735 [Deltaproteobacteria bacterium]|nr:hypothetical protein [Deltaproteobacteria bacterium]MBW2051618.1 hypothetical protein [Deltaproteobacteria bacterium]MBW2140752.1 hypothetical protein [Deltaproteobacteria bacterium]MBW2322702.1 hypothetical protein [Deltaproteobacteria bacterium]
MLWLKELKNPLLPEHTKMNFVSASNAATLPESIFATQSATSKLREWWEKLTQTFTAMNQLSVTELNTPKNPHLRHKPELYYEIRKANAAYEAIQAGLRIIQ